MNGAPFSIAPADFIAQWKEVGADVHQAVERVGASGWYILGKEVEKFETALASAWGLGHAIGTGNGLDAIEIGLRCLGIQSGDRVLTTPLSAFATTLAIVRSGGVPVFVDTDECGLIDLHLCRDLLTSDRRIRFMVPVHLYGHAVDLTTLESLRDDFDLKVLEDCAQAIGARSGDRVVGSVGQVAATSFYPTKNLGAIGDAGAILTSDATLARRARSLRHYGQSANYVHDELGLNSRMDELQAAILNDALLPRLTHWTSRRREIAQQYLSQLPTTMKALVAPASSASVWHQFPVRVATKRRDSLRSHLLAAGIATSVHYPTLIPAQKALVGAGRPEVHGALDRARAIADGEVSLPMHPYLSPTEVTHVTDALRAWTP